MYCEACQNEVESCTCADLDERMRKLSGPGGPITCRWCARCDQHYARCTCGEPVWRLRWNGELIDHPSLVQFNA